MTASVFISDISFRASMDMNFFALSGLLNGLAATGLMALVYSRSPRDLRHWTFILFGLATAIWSYGYCAWHVSSDKEFALFYVRLLMAGAIFIPVTFLHHVVVLRDLLPDTRVILKACYAIGVCFLFTDLTPFFVADVRTTMSFPYWPVPGPLFHVFLIWWVGVVVYSHVLLGRAVFQEKGIRRQQFSHLLLGSSIGYAGGATNFPLWYGIELLPYGTICFTVYIALVAYALLRYHLLDFSIYVERGLSYLGVLFLISQPAFPILLLAQQSIFGAISLRFSLVQAAVHLLTVAGAYQLKVGTRGAIARTVMRGRELRFKTFSRFSSTVANSSDLDTVGQEIVHTFCEELHAKTAVLYLLDQENNQYAPVSFYGERLALSSYPRFSVTHELPRYLAIVQREVLWRELEHLPSDGWKVIVAETLARMEADICVPFITKNRLLGFCLLLRPLMQQATEPGRAVQLLAPLIQEAALSLENALLQKEVQRSRALVLHLDRLRSLEAMAGGLAHELRMPLTTIKAFTQLAQLRKDDEEFLARFRAVVAEDIERIERLTKEIREYMQADQPVFVRTDVNKILYDCVSHLSHNPEFRKYKVDLSLSPQLPLVSANRQQLKQALFNILLDCLTDEELEGECVCVRSYAVKAAANDRWIQIEIFRTQDHGLHRGTQAGHSEFLMTEAVRRSSMAEGLVIVEEIIQSHGGIFSVRAVREGIQPTNQPAKLYVVNLPETEHASTEEGSRSASIRLESQAVARPLCSERQPDPGKERYIYSQSEGDS
ncbi:MAG: hypothetical protein D6690_10215 [Nitrospirae bacterium]|nr:MAG: hypothetical protein D6690_10215 [Nitrospirota bacterium]